MNKVYSKRTPIIRPIANTGGTFYTFPSAAEDFSFSFSEQSSKKFKFSKFALLNIPEISDDPTKYENNLLRLMAIPGINANIKNRNYNDFNLNSFFAESLQNYCLNLETGIISKDDYIQNEDRTVSERVFFKWLKEMGAIRFENDKNSELFIEENNNNYNSVVKYLGNIDFINNYSGSINTYNEIIMNIPTEHGSFSKVYFNSIEDNNYYPEMTITKNDKQPFIFGYGDDIINDPLAFYDKPNTTEIKFKKFKSLTSNIADINNWSNDWWFDETQAFTYHTDEKFANADNDLLAIADIDNENDMETWTMFKRNKLDGISINFDPNNYKNILHESTISSLADVAMSLESQNFDFNCILVYYDLYTKDEFEILQYPDDDAGQSEFETYEDSSLNILSTNLFGVLFLDKVTVTQFNTLNDNTPNTSLGRAYIPSLTKCMPNKETNLNGNSYGFKLNIKLDISNTNVNIETYISDSKTFSLDVFADALNGMHEITELFKELVFDNLKFNDRLRYLEDSEKSLNRKTILNLNDRLTELENVITTNNLMLSIVEKKELISLINNNYKILNDLLNNKTSMNVAFDLGTIQNKNGIIIERNEDGIILSTDESTFNFKEDWKIYDPDSLNTNKWKSYSRESANPFYEYEFKLKPTRNYVRIYNDSGFKSSGDYILKIKDIKKWKTGQCLRISFDKPYLLKNGNNTYKFIIKTDILNDYNNIIKTFQNSDFELCNNKPIIEIYCVNENSLEFIVDVLN